MEILKKIMFELDYIYDIYDDIKFTYDKLDNKKDIVYAYNIDDLILLNKMSSISKYTKSINSEGKIIIDFHDMVLRYDKVQSPVEKVHICLQDVFKMHVWLNYDTKEYIKVSKSLLHEHVIKMESYYK